MSRMGGLEDTKIVCSRLHLDKNFHRNRNDCGLSYDPVECAWKLELQFTPNTDHNPKLVPLSTSPPTWREDGKRKRSLGE